MGNEQFSVESEPWSCTKCYLMNIPQMQLRTQFQKLWFTKCTNVRPGSVLSLLSQFDTCEMCMY